MELSSDEKLIRIRPSNLKASSIDRTLELFRPGLGSTRTVQRRVPNARKIHKAQKICLKNQAVWRNAEDERPDRLLNPRGWATNWQVVDRGHYDDILKQTLKPLEASRHWATAQDWAEFYFGIEREVRKQGLTEMETLEKINTIILHELLQTIHSCAIHIFEGKKTIVNEIFKFLSAMPIKPPKATRKLSRLQVLTRFRKQIKFAEDQVTKLAPTLYKIVFDAIMGKVEQSKSLVRPKSNPCSPRGSISYADRNTFSKLERSKTGSPKSLDLTPMIDLAKEFQAMYKRVARRGNEAETLRAFQGLVNQLIIDFRSEGFKVEMQGSKWLPNTVGPWGDLPMSMKFSHPRMNSIS